MAETTLESDNSILTKLQDALPDGVQEQAQHAAAQVSTQVTTQVRQQLADRSTQAGEQLSSLGTALRNSANELRSQGSGTPAQLLAPVADKTEQLGEYLRATGPDQLLHDLEDFGRKQPWVVIVGGVAAGFLASRFLKASSSRRYAQSHRSPTVFEPVGSPRTGAF
jgi:hypothetical protein